jgi:hypothetical protein
VRKADAAPGLTQDYGRSALWHVLTRSRNTARQLRNQGSDFIVMEFVKGRRLSELILPNGSPVDVVFRYGIQIAEALAHARQDSSGWSRASPLAICDL